MTLVESLEKSDEKNPAIDTGVTRKVYHALATLFILFLFGKRKKNSARTVSDHAVHISAPNPQRIMFVHGTYALFSYQQVQKPLGLCKYYDHHGPILPFIHTLADFMHEYIEEIVFVHPSATIFIIPAPASVQRILKRRTQHMMHVAESCCALLNRYYSAQTHYILAHNICFRTDRSTPQARKHKYERVNVGHTYYVSRRWLKLAARLPEAHCILLDDVVSTGTTLLKLKKAIHDAWYKATPQKPPPTLHALTLAWSGTTNMVDSTYWRRG